MNDQIMTGPSHSAAFPPTKLPVWLTLIVILLAPSLNAVADDEADASDAVVNSQPAESDTTGSPPTLSTNKRVLPKPEWKQGTDLQRHMQLFNRSEEVIPLNTDTTEFFGLFLQERTGTPNGAILILHDNAQHGHWPNVIAPLREYLPDYGWATLTIELPTPPSQEIPMRSSAGVEPEPEGNADEADATNPGTENTAAPETAMTDDDNNDIQDLNTEDKDNDGPDTEKGSTPPTEIENSVSETNDQQENEPGLPRLSSLPDLASNESQAKNITPETAEMMTPWETYQQDARARINSAMQYLQQMGQLNLAMTGSGEGAYWAADYVSRYVEQLEDPENDKGLVLITIDPRISPQQNNTFEENMTVISVPFAEILTEASSRQDAKRRKGKMRHFKQNSYQQFILPNMPRSPGSDTPITRRIRGWLKTNAAGTQVKLSDD